MADESLIGREFPEYSFPVEKGKIREMALAIGDDNPIYHCSKTAKAEGYRDVVTTPTFGTVIDMWGGNDFDETCRVLDINPVMVLHGEQHYEYFGEINPGDMITAKPKISNVVVKSGKSGSMKLITMETTYYNQRGEKVMVCRGVTVERQPA
ncbi:MAG: FAS1-like dehydratase domain-containing protein [Bacillota bacterium]